MFYVYIVELKNRILKLITTINTRQLEKAFRTVQCMQEVDKNFRKIYLNTKKCIIF